MQTFAQILLYKRPLTKMVAHFLKKIQTVTESMIRLILARTHPQEKLLTQMDVHPLKEILILTVLTMHSTNARTLLLAMLLVLMVARYPIGHLKILGCVLTDKGHGSKTTTAMETDILQIQTGLAAQVEAVQDHGFSAMYR